MIGVDLKLSFFLCLEWGAMMLWGALIYGCDVVLSTGCFDKMMMQDGGLLQSLGCVLCPSAFLHVRHHGQGIEVFVQTATYEDNLPA
jgi:hypothetical protein